MITEIRHGDELLAIIMSRRFDQPGIHFFTPEECSQQFGFMRHPAGKVIEPHAHHPTVREIRHTQEVLVIRKGRLRVDFYDDDRHYLESRVLEAGDVILLAGGGHGFEALEELEMIEVKQGPYIADRDKVRFPGIASAQARILPLS